MHVCMMFCFIRSYEMCYDASTFWGWGFLTHSCFLTLFPLNILWRPLSVAPHRRHFRFSNGLSGFCGTLSSIVVSSSHLMQMCWTVTPPQQFHAVEASEAPSSTPGPGEAATAGPPLLERGPAMSLGTPLGMSDGTPAHRQHWL